VWDILGRIRRFGPNTQAFIQKLENGIKSIILRQSNLFEAMNFRYFGPVDGHDVIHLTKVLTDLKKIQGPKLLHVITKKGKGFRPAELNQTMWHHAPACFNKDTGEILKSKATSTDAPKYQDVFGLTIIELAKSNPKIMGITPAMPSGCSLNLMMEKMPDRAFDVGIAEQHAVTFSAGLATKGLIPFCNIYSTFMQRAYDQVIHDVALQKLNVVFCLDRAGLVGSDGATHHGAFDIPYMRCVPNLTIAAPLDEIELRNLMYTAQLGGKGPFVIRYPRGKGVMHDWQKPFAEIKIGKGRVIREGTDLAILSIGTIGNQAIEVCERFELEEIQIAHYDMRFVKPLDTKLLHKIFKKFNNIITIEDGALSGGFGSAILEFMSDNGYHAHIKRLGIPDRFVDQGTQEQLYIECGYDVETLYKTAKQMLSEDKKFETQFVKGFIPDFR